MSTREDREIIQNDLEILEIGVEHNKIQVGKLPSIFEGKILKHSYEIDERKLESNNTQEIVGSKVDKGMKCIVAAKEAKTICSCIENGITLHNRE